MKKYKSLPTKHKARKMLEEGLAHGKKLTKKQKRLFSLLASGKKPKRV